MANRPIPEAWLGQAVGVTVLAASPNALETTLARATPLGARNLSGLLEDANEEGIVVRNQQLEELVSFFPWSSILAVRFPVS